MPNSSHEDKGPPNAKLPVFPVLWPKRHKVPPPQDDPQAPPARTLETPLHARGPIGPRACSGVSRVRAGGACGSSCGGGTLWRLGHNTGKTGNLALGGPLSSWLEFGMVS